MRTTTTTTWRLPTYTWRGRTFRSLAGLQGLIQGSFPGASLTFGEAIMEIGLRDGRRLRFERTFVRAPDGTVDSVIGEEPIPESVAA